MGMHMYTWYAAIHVTGVRCEFNTDTSTSTGAGAGTDTATATATAALHGFVLTPDTPTTWHTTSEFDSIHIWSRDDDMCERRSLVEVLSQWTVLARVLHANGEEKEMIAA